LLHDAIKCVWNKVHYDVKINLIRLLPICVEKLSHFNAVWVMKSLQNFKLTVLVALVLEDFLDCDGLSGFGDSSLEDNTERAVPDNLFGIIG
jgi:hypothetical protein